ncbi:MAG TPA: LacI family DNA-binding transcriptional regulator [Bryobacteraceae bacterium]|nr:LacI family DNA-binding transcriptional regulator [Bryobacteraceae bacterium]
MAARMKDVAERAGVSVTTVSHVLNSTPHRPIAAATRDRILAAVRELDYHADANARRLAQNRSNLFGLVVSEIANPFFPDVIKAFETSALAHGFDVLLCNTEYDAGRTHIAVRKMIENKVRGVAVITSMFDRVFAEELASREVPVVVLGAGLAGPGISAVELEFGRGMGQAIDHLIELGHEEIAFVSGPQHIASAIRIRDAFVHATGRRRVRTGRVVQSNYKVDGGASAVAALAAADGFPTAIACGNDLIAVGVISALEDVGISVPADVSVIGYDNILVSRLARPPLTTVEVPRELLGRTAFRALENMQRSPSHTGRVHKLGTELVIRRSTAAVRTEGLGPRSREAANAR